MLAPTLGFFAMIASPCPASDAETLEERPAVRAELPAWGVELLEADRALAEALRALLARDRIELPTFVRELGLESDLGRDLGFGASLHKFGVRGGVGHLGVELVAAQEGQVLLVAQARIRFGCGGCYIEDVCPIAEFRLAVQSVWPGEYHVPDGGGSPGFRSDWKSVDALAGLRRQRVDALGAAPGVDVPPELSPDLETLTSWFRPLAFGDSGGISGQPLPGRLATDRLTDAGRFDLLRVVLRGPDAAGRVFAAEALLIQEQANAADLFAIRQLRTQQVPYCGGGCSTGRRPVGEVLDQRLGR